MSESEITSDLAALTVQLLSAYLSNNIVASDDLAGLIRSTKEALTAETATSPVEPAIETFTPAVSVRKSLTSPEHIISLIDGKPYKTLKRHLTTQGLTPDKYRARYGLPADYPMVAPAYSALRRDVAQKLGLGRRAAPTAQAGDEAIVAPDPIDPEASPPVAAPKATKRRPKAAAAKTGVSARKSKVAIAGDEGTPEVIPPAAAAPPEGEVAVDATQSSATSPDDNIVKSKVSHAPVPRKAEKQPSKKKPVKRSKSPAAKPMAAEEANFEATRANDDPELDRANVGSEKPDAKPKRRSKIGLFGKEGVQATPPADHDKGPAVDVAEGVQSEPTNDATSDATASLKAGRPKRMARTPQPSAT